MTEADLTLQDKLQSTCMRAELKYGFLSTYEQTIVLEAGTSLHLVNIAVQQYLMSFNRIRRP